MAEHLTDRFSKTLVRANGVPNVVLQVGFLFSGFGTGNFPGKTEYFILLLRNSFLPILCESIKQHISLLFFKIPVPGKFLDDFTCKIDSILFDLRYISNIMIV